MVSEGFCAGKLNHRLESKEFILLVFHGHGHFLHKRKKQNNVRTHVQACLLSSDLFIQKRILFAKSLKGFQFSLC